MNDCYCFTVHCIGLQEEFNRGMYRDNYMWKYSGSVYRHVF